LKNQVKLDTPDSTIEVIHHVLLSILDVGFNGIFVVILT
jgi:hypothetical protein